MTVINDLPLYYCEFHFTTVNFIRSWLAENGSKHALAINIGSVIALVSVFRQSCESLYLYNVLGDIKYIIMEVLMFALRSLGPLITSGMVLCSDE